MGLFAGFSLMVFFELGYLVVFILANKELPSTGRASGENIFAYLEAMTLHGFQYISLSG